MVSIYPYYWPSINTQDFQVMLLGIGIGCLVSLVVLVALVVFLDD